MIRLPGVEPIGQRPGGFRQRGVEPGVRRLEQPLRYPVDLHAEALAGVLRKRQRIAVEAPRDGAHRPDLCGQVSRPRRVEREVVQQPVGVLDEPSGCRPALSLDVGAPRIRALVDQHSPAGRLGDQAVEAQRQRGVAP